MAEVPFKISLFQQLKHITDMYVIMKYQIQKLDRYVTHKSNIEIINLNPLIHQQNTSKSVTDH